MSLNTGNAILSNAITVDGSYNVGIGGSPSGSYKFDVTGTGRYTSTLLVGGTATFSSDAILSYNKSLAFNSTSNQYISADASNLYLGTANSARLTINTSGFVGIGTTGPGDILDVQRNQNATTNFYLRNTSTTDTNSRAYLNLVSGNVSYIMKAVNNDHCYVEATNDMFFQTGGSTRMVIKSTGLVGIGTTSPNQIFTIKAAGGNNGLISFQSAAGVNTAYFGIPNANGDVVTTSTTADLCVRGETGNILFAFSNQERMRLTNGGDLYVNTTGNYGTTTVSVRSAWSAGSYGQVQFYTGTGNSTIRSSVPGNSTNGIQILTYSAASGDKITANFDGAGNVYNYNNTTTWQQTSDIRVKENINTISNALDKVIRLNPVTFDYKQEFATDKNWDDTKKIDNVGFIAQEFETVFPKYVHSTQDKVGNQTIEDFKSIDTGHLVPYLVKAIQELNQTIQNQQQQINQLINK